MAFQDMPLSDLDSATSVGDSDLMYIVQGGVSKKATRGQATSGFAHLVNGTVPLSELPKTALDNLVKVANDTARFALTTAQVQNGDSVEVLSTDKMYLVVDDTKLDEEAGYKEYAATVDWSTIQGKPNNLVKSVPVGTPSGGAMSPILHKSDVVDSLNSSSTTSPLSANQGKNLKQNVDTLSQSLTECVKKKSTADITVSTATGRTIAQALNILVNSANFDISKVTPFSYIKNGVAFYRVSSITSNRAVFTYEAVGVSTPTIISLYAQVGNNIAYSYNGTTVTAVGGETLSSALEFYY